jgi:hypothetical protein
VGSDSAGAAICSTLDPQIAIAVVAILGAVSHAAVAILRGLQDYRHGTGQRQTRAGDLDTG